MAEVDRVRERAAMYKGGTGQMGEPLEVRDTGGSQVSWFVPIEESGYLVGFVELLPDLNHKRTSSFQRRPGSYEGCPAAPLWLDPAVVVDTARSQMEQDEVPGQPYLSFDQAPDRLAWVVPVRGAGGTRTIFVAGEAAWRASSVPGIG